MAIVKELKNLGKKMTGADLAGNTVSEALKAIEEKYTGGSAAPAFETAFKLTLGTMEKDPSGDSVLYLGAVSVDSVPTESTLYFGSEDVPMQRNKYDGAEAVYHYNVNFAEGKLEDESKHGYVLLYQKASGDGYLCTVASDEDLSGQTITILRQVSAPDEDSNDFIVRATLTTGEGSFDLSDADAGFSDILAAVKAGKTVKLRASSGIESGISIMAEMPLGGITGNGGPDSTISFYCVVSMGDSGEAALAAAIALPDNGNLRFVTTLMPIAAGSSDTP